MNYLDDRLKPRFWNKCVPEPNSGCWLWCAATNGVGYGRLSIGGGRSDYAHRIAYRALVGEIPAGLEIDHRCRTRCCVNPAHLEPVTRRENLHRSPVWRASPGADHIRRRSHCPKGHPYDELNTMPIKRGGVVCGRACRACVNAKQRRGHARRRAARLAAEGKVR